MKMYVFGVVFAFVLLAGCAQHSGPLSLRAPAEHATPAKAAVRVPLTLSIDGVHFDQAPRPQAVDALEKQGFEPLRVDPHYDCDTFRAPASLPGASRLTACWVRMHDIARWAEAWLTFPPVLHVRTRHHGELLHVRTLRFGALLHVLAQKFGDRGSFWLHSPGPLRATWRPYRGRGLVRLTQGFPEPVMRLRIADVHALRALLKSAARQTAARQRADNPLVSHPTPAKPAALAPRPAAPVAINPPRPGAGFPRAVNFYPSAARRLGEEGTVRVRVCIGPRGRVRSESVARSSDARVLDQAALRYARATSGHWHPAMRGGQPIVDCTTRPVRFSLMGGF